MIAIIHTNAIMNAGENTVAIVPNNIPVNIIRGNVIIITEILKNITNGSVSVEYISVTSGIRFS